MKEKRRPPRILHIAEYWEWRCVKCGERQCECGNQFICFIDAGEPECARCKMFRGYSPGKEVWRAWEEFPDSDLERAHLVPVWRYGMGDVADGLQESVENYVLLCHWCHKEDPEPLTRQEHLDWMAAYRQQQHDALEALHEYIRSRPVERLYNEDLDPIELALQIQAMPNYPAKSDRARENHKQFLEHERTRGKGSGA